MDFTTIRLSGEVADTLHDMKRRGESYDDVLRRVLDDGGIHPDGDRPSSGNISPPDERGESGGDDGRRERRGEPTGAAEPSDTTRERGEADAEGVLRAADLPGSGTDKENRIAAVVNMYEYLKERPGERVGKAELREHLDGVEVGYKGGFGSLWSNFIKKNESQGRDKNTLTRLPGVTHRGDDYVYVGDSE